MCIRDSASLVVYLDLDLLIPVLCAHINAGQRGSLGDDLGEVLTGHVALKVAAFEQVEHFERLEGRRHEDPSQDLLRLLRRERRRLDVQLLKRLLPPDEREQDVRSGFVVPQEVVPAQMQRLQRAELCGVCLLYTSPSPRDRTRSRMPSSA